MFETSVVRAKAKVAERRIGLLSVSVAAHAAAIAGVVAASVASVHLPDRAPNQVALISIPVVPQMHSGSVTGGRKPDAPKPAAAPPQKRETTPPPRTDVAPATVPEHVVPLQPGPPSDLPQNTDPKAPIGDGSRIGNPSGPIEGADIGSTTPAPPAPADVVYQVGAGVKAPVVIRRVSPVYPPLAINGHMSGFAVVQCVIDKTGHIRDARIVGSSFRLFEQPALDAVQQWVFAPGTKDGQPVDVQFELRVTFTLTR